MSATCNNIKHTDSAPPSTRERCRFASVSPCPCGKDNIGAREGDARCQAHATTVAHAHSCTRLAALAPCAREFCSEHRPRPSPRLAMASSSCAAEHARIRWRLAFVVLVAGVGVSSTMAAGKHRAGVCLSCLLLKGSRSRSEKPQTPQCCLLGNCLCTLSLAIVLG